MLIFLFFFKFISGVELDKYDFSSISNITYNYTASTFVFHFIFRSDLPVEGDCKNLGCMAAQNYYTQSYCPCFGL